MRHASPPDWLVLFTLWLMAFAVSSQFMVIAPLLPRISTQLGVPEGALGLLVAGYAAAVAVTAILMGPVSDRVGRRRMLLTGTGMMAVALVLHGLAFDFTSLLVVRTLAGVGGGVLTGAAAAYVGDHFPYERRGWALGWLTSGMAAGQILGVPLGALLADRIGFRVPFMVFGAVMALAWTAGRTFLPRPSVTPSSDRLSLAGGLRHYRALLGRRGAGAGALVYLTIFTGSALFTVYFPTWLEASRSVTADQVAVVFSIGGVATILFGPVSGRFSDVVGRRIVVVGASLSLALLLGVTPWAVGGVWSAAALFFVLMGMIAARSGALDALLTEVVAGEHRGALMSLLMATGQVGFGAGGALAGWLYGAFGYPAAASGAAIAAAAVAVIAWRFLPEPQQAAFAATRLHPGRARILCRSVGRPDER